MTLEKLLSVFLSRNVAAEIIGSYTGDSSPFLKVIYPDMLPIIIWINQHENCRAQLQMAATILTRNEKKICKESRLQNMISNLNGSGNFGARVSWILCKRVFLTLRHPVLKLDIKPI